MTLLDLLPLVAIAAAFWLLLIRPAQRRRREQDQLVASLAPGQRLMTTAGVFGTLRAINDEVVVLEVAPGVEIEMLAVAIARVMPAEDSDAASSAGGSVDVVAAVDAADGADGADDMIDTPDPAQSSARREADRG